ncbi:MAG: hypothetical protein IM638_02680 [Bacteroidetes bacterium]|nr:hypothetical protein [Bacteroidota bacterium]
MITRIQIRESIIKKELVLDWWGKLNHFSPAIFILIIGLIFLFFVLKELIINGSVKEIVFRIVIGCFWIAVSVYIYCLQKRRLKLIEVDVDLSMEEKDMIIQNVAQELEWLPVLIDNNVIICKTYPGVLSGSWGEQITILFEGNKIFINSICDPDKQMSLTSRGRNRKNVNRLLEELQKVSDNK